MINSRWEGAEVFTTCERPQGLALVATHFRIEQQVEPSALPDMPPGLCLKMIPSAEEGKPFEVLQYVSDNTDIVPRADASGRYEIYGGTGSVMMPMATAVWPVHTLQPIGPVTAFLIRGDMDFGYGEILRDFNR